MEMLFTEILTIRGRWKKHS